MDQDKNQPRPNPQEPNQPRRQPDDQPHRERRELEQGAQNPRRPMPGKGRGGREGDVDEMPPTEEEEDD